MGNFNRGRSGGGFGRRDFNDRSSRGPAQMHPATCDKCKQSCEVPFRPTSGKPVYCSNCFDRNRSSDSGRSFSENGGRNSEERRMFEATCDECKNSCKVPFQPSGDKPVYCSNCFGEKKGASERNESNPQYGQQFEQLNSKLDQILLMLTSKNEAVPAAAVLEEAAEEIIEDPVKAPKKKPQKKK